MVMVAKKKDYVCALVRSLRLMCSVLLVMSVVDVAAQNPYLPLWEHLPDGEPRVFEDPDNPGKYRAYIIGSHDVTYTGYCVRTRVSGIHSSHKYKCRFFASEKRISQSVCIVFCCLIEKRNE